MKILIFSDTHLTHEFDKELFDYIAKLVKSADQVIINGDFWDAYLTTFDEFCNSKWKKLFPLLKAKSTVYIFGNHDRENQMDERMNLFSSVQLYNYEFKSGKKTFYVTHGDVASPAYDAWIIFNNPNYIRPFYKLLWKFINSKFIFPIFRFFEYRVDQAIVKEIEEYAQQFIKAGKFFVAGHSHVPKYNYEGKFISLNRLQESYKGYCYIDNGEIDFYSKGGW